MKKKKFVISEQKGAEVQKTIDRQREMIRPKRSRLEMVSVRDDSLGNVIIGTNDGLGMARDVALDLKTVESVAIYRRENELFPMNS